MTDESPPADRPAEKQERGLSRRKLFGMAGLGTAGVLASGTVGGVVGRTTAARPPSPVVSSSAVQEFFAPVEFTGTHRLAS